MQIEHLDHLVLTVADIPTTCDFYARVLGMRPVTFAGGRTALAFGRQKINLHPHGGEFEPKAARPTCASSSRRRWSRRSPTCRPAACPSRKVR